MSLTNGRLALNYNFNVSLNFLLAPLTCCRLSLCRLNLGVGQTVPLSLTLVTRNQIEKTNIRLYGACLRLRREELARDLRELACLLSRNTVITCRFVGCRIADDASCAIPD